MHDNNQLSELLEAIDMESWLDSQAIDYTRTRGRSGVQLNVRVCPVCGNSDRKVYLNLETGLGNCFGGSHPPPAKFNKWSFIRAHLGEVSGKQVVEHIKHYVESRGWMPKRIKSVAVDKPVELVLPISFELPYGGKNITYLVNRGITDDITRYFHLRYCHDGWFNYEFEGKRKGMFFGQRVLIPVFDLDGKMVNFQGRDITGAQEPKYQFPPGLPSTGIHLLNGMNVRDTKRVAIGEGGFDVMAIKMAFDEEASLRDVVPVGTFGKSLSWGSGDSQEAKFRVLMDRGVEEVTFMWDGEVKATDAAIEAGFRLRSMGLRVRIAMLPKDADPNEVPASVVRQAFFEAVPLTMQSAILIKHKRRAMNADR
jgi:DNA primase